MISPRFFGDDVLESCLSGHRIFNGSGDPPESVGLIQQALQDLGFTVDVNGVFDSQTDDAVTAFKDSQSITPNDPVVGPETMGALDANFAHELIDAKANAIAGSRFDLGSRLGQREDLEDGFAISVFQNGLCVEMGHCVAYAMPAAVQESWIAAGGLDGTFGAPTSDPMVLDVARSVQEFAFVARIFGGAQDFTLPRAVWEASIAGGGMIGMPIGAPQAIGSAGAVSFRMIQAWCWWFPKRHRNRCRRPCSMRGARRKPAGRRWERRRRSGSRGRAAMCFHFCWAASR